MHQISRLEFLGFKVQTYITASSDELLRTNQLRYLNQKEFANFVGKLIWLVNTDEKGQGAIQIFGKSIRPYRLVFYDINKQLLRCRDADGIETDFRIAAQPVILSQQDATASKEQINIVEGSEVSL